MPKTDAFNRYADDYEAWFERYPHVYQAELRALERLIDPHSEGVEIGVGTGRFAVPLGICTGVEPSAVMAAAAGRRGIKIVSGVAEDIPYDDDAFDFALMVTTICFVDDPLVAFREAFRVTRENGYFVVGFVDASSPLGQNYETKRDESRFYKDAHFFSTDELVELLQLAGFHSIIAAQTIFSNLDTVGPDEAVLEGHGKGSFVALRADKQKKGSSP